MSGGDGNDPRVLRTREALLEAFRGLVTTRRYGELKVGEIVAEAAVGRSTFYDHFRGKDEMLLASMAPLLELLADVAREDADAAPLVRLLEHFQENRRLARELLGPSSEAAPRIARALATRIEARVAERARRGGSAGALPVHLVAAQIAQAELALVVAWLSDAAPCGARELAVGLRRGTQGALAALFDAPAG